MGLQRTVPSAVMMINRINTQVRTWKRFPLLYDYGNSSMVIS